jgi:phenylalanyl-tRNA synthetase beta chain
MSRDIAMWVDESTTEEAAVVVLNAAAGDLRVRTTHVDTFVKDGRKSLAFRLVFQAPDRTLTDAEVNEHMDKVYKAAEAEGWETR